MLFFTILDEIQAKKPCLIFNFSFLILDGVFWVWDLGQEA
jgi:hypothetical protein